MNHEQKRVKTCVMMGFGSAAAFALIGHCFLLQNPIMEYFMERDDKNLMAMAMR